MMTATRSGVGEMRRSESREVDLPRRNIESRMPKLTTCESAVERPAPVMPMPKPNMKTASPAMLRKQPAVMPTMPSAALPSSRRIWFMVKLAVMNGAEMSMKRTYSSA